MINKKLRKIYDETIECKGSSITLDLELLEPCFNQYVVSLSGFEEQIPYKLSYTRFLECVLEKLRKAQTLINGRMWYSDKFQELYSDTILIGFWYNDDNKHWYSDISVIIYGKQTALQVAKANKQLAIFDTYNKQVIEVA